MNSRVRELPSQIDTDWLAKFRRNVRTWYRRHARDLPWRSQTDPYAIWVSEIMLQQTQVATVIPYFQRFLADLPNIAALASADEATVLRLWEGLGYYRRARQMQAAARQIVDQHNAKFPIEFDAILALPGIGRYTAGAIASFAYDQRRPIVEANTQRLFARLLNEQRTLTASATQQVLWEFAEAILPRKNVGQFNQALMELGGQVCKPKNPDCSTCPVSQLCEARRAGTVDRVPRPKPKKEFEQREHALVCIRNKTGEWLTRLCETDEHWAGLWDFPRFDLTDIETQRDCETATESAFESEFGRAIKIQSRFKTIRHGVTRFKIKLDCFDATFSDRRRLQTSRTTQWVATKDLHSLPLNSSGRKVANLLVQRTSDSPV